MSATTTPVAFSYVRFSTPEQLKGDSLRRQTAATEDWCVRNGIRLDTSLTLRDLGKSAFKGSHRGDKAALGGFLKVVAAGKVPRGSYLVIENLDRLSREEERTALRLWLDILDHGINIVQLHPETVFRHERSDMTDIIRAIIELSRGHSESRMKSQRVAAAWSQKRVHARNGRLLTRRLPAWVRVEGIERDGYTLALDHDRADTIRRIFDMAAEGLGLARVVGRLTAEGVPAFGPSGKWSRAYVRMLLTDRRVIGELQTRRQGGAADGPPIADYFPRVVSDDTFHKAQAAIVQRRRREGKRVGRRVDLFAGLVRDAIDGGAFVSSTRNDGNGPTRVLRNQVGSEGQGKCRSFPLATFEWAVLKMLAEVNPDEVFGNGKPGNTVADTEGELSGVRARLAELAEQLAGGGAVALIANEAARLEARERELAAKLEEAEREAAAPAEQVWHNVRPALTAAALTPDDRLRLRSALGRLVDEITLLVVSAGRDRLASVQVRFAGGGQLRHFHILHRPPHWSHDHTVPGLRAVFSLAHNVEPGQVDLRTPEGVEYETKMLSLFRWDTDHPSEEEYSGRCYASEELPS